MKTLSHTFGNGQTITLTITAVYRPSHGKEGTSPIGTCRVQMYAYPSREECTITAQIDGKDAEYQGAAGDIRQPAKAMHRFRIVRTAGPDYGVPASKIDPLIAAEEAEAQAALSPEWRAIHALLAQPLPEDPSEDRLMRSGPRQAAAWAQRKAYEVALDARSQALRAFLASDAPEAILCRQELATWTARAEQAVWNG